jgi:hypothetical protein
LEGSDHRPIKVLSQQLLEGTDGTTKTLSKNSRRIRLERLSLMLRQPLRFDGDYYNDYDHIFNDDGDFDDDDNCQW